MTGTPLILEPHFVVTLFEDGALQITAASEWSPPVLGSGGSVRLSAEQAAQLRDALLSSIDRAPV